MAMIILCHFLQYSDLELAWWLNVGVQIFFTISGFLYGAKEIDQPIAFFSKQFRKILVPYWIIIGIVSVVHKLYIPTVFSWGRVISAVICVGTIPGMEHLWFIPYILICYLILPYLLYLKNTALKYSAEKRIIAAVGIFVAFQFVGFTFKGYGMIPNRVSCFLCGVIFAELRKKKPFFRRTGIIMCVVALLLNIVRIYGVYLLKIESNLIFDLFTRYAHGILGITIFLVLYGLFENATYTVVLKFSDRYSYYIYLVHQIYILGPLSLMKLTPNMAINICFICCCIMISGIFLEKVTVRMNCIADKWLSRIE